MNQIKTLSIVALAFTLAACSPSCRQPENTSTPPGPAVTGSVAYYPASHVLQVSGGFTFHFKEAPPAEVQNQLTAAGGRPGTNEVTWILPAVTNLSQLNAAQAALVQGAKVTGGIK